jgi:hypothetical protein
MTSAMVAAGILFFSRRAIVSLFMKGKNMRFPREQR